MRKLSLSLAVFVLAVLAFGEARAAPTCTPTGFSRDSINLTAALIDPPGTFSGDVDATGCNIGIFYDANAGKNANLNGASVHGANYFGVVRYGASVSINNTVVYQIGEQPFNGLQHGVAIYCAYDSPQSSTGDITNSVIYAYQKGGIVVNGPNCTANIVNNTVIGQGPVNYIAQNGIQAGYGSRVPTIQNNYVFGNSYTGSGGASSGGIILVGGACYGSVYETNSRMLNNTVVGNDVGLWLSNIQGDCISPPVTPTNNSVFGNTATDNADNNTTGDITAGYQAGILDQGDGDYIVGNQVCGIGYAPMSTATMVSLPIDTTDTNNVFVQGNTGCQFSVNGPQPHGHGHRWVFPHR